MIIHSIYLFDILVNVHHREKCFIKILSVGGERFGQVKAQLGGEVGAGYHSVHWMGQGWNLVLWA